MNKLTLYHGWSLKDNSLDNNNPLFFENNFFFDKNSPIYKNKEKIFKEMLHFKNNTSRSDKVITFFLIRKTEKLFEKIEDYPDFLLHFCHKDLYTNSGTQPYISFSFDYALKELTHNRENKDDFYYNGHVIRHNNQSDFFLDNNLDDFIETIHNLIKLGYSIRTINSFFISLAKHGMANINERKKAYYSHCEKHNFILKEEKIEEILNKKEREFSFFNTIKEGECIDIVTTEDFIKNPNISTDSLYFSLIFSTVFTLLQDLCYTQNTIKINLHDHCFYSDNPEHVEIVNEINMFTKNYLQNRILLKPLSQADKIIDINLFDYMFDHLFIMNTPDILLAPYEKYIPLFKEKFIPLSERHQLSQLIEPEEETLSIKKRI